MMNTSLYKCYIDYANAIFYAYIRPRYFSIATKFPEILLDLMASRDDWKYDLWIYESIPPSLFLSHLWSCYFYKITRWSYTFYATYTLVYLGSFTYLS